MTRGNECCRVGRVPPLRLELVGLEASTHPTSTVTDCTRKTAPRTTCCPGGAATRGSGRAPQSHRDRGVRTSCRSATRDNQLSGAPDKTFLGRSSSVHSRRPSMTVELRKRIVSETPHTGDGFKSSKARMAGRYRNEACRRRRALWSDAPPTRTAPRGSQIEASP